LLFDAKAQRRRDDTSGSRRLCWCRGLDPGGRHFGLFRLLDDRGKRWRGGRRLFRRLFRDRGLNGDGCRNLDRGRRHLDRFGNFRRDLNGRWGRRGSRGLHRLDEARRRQRWARGLDWLGGLLRRRRSLFAFCGRRFSENVAAWQRDVALAGEPLDELPRDDLLDRARRALGVDAETLQERGDFLA